MTVGYEEGIIIISLAMFGLYAIIEELWHIKWKSKSASTVTILLVVQNAEASLEYLLRAILDEIVSHRAELIVADVTSGDRTRAILHRLAEETDVIRVIHSETKRQAIADGVAIARGDFVHVCDLVHRIDTEECIEYLGQLAKIESI